MIENARWVRVALYRAKNWFAVMDNLDIYDEYCFSWKFSTFIWHEKNIRNGQ